MAVTLASTAAAKRRVSPCGAPSLAPHACPQTAQRIAKRFVRDCRQLRRVCTLAIGSRQRARRAFRSRHPLYGGLHEAQRSDGAIAEAGVDALDDLPGPVLKLDGAWPVN